MEKQLYFIDIVQGPIGCFLEPKNELFAFTGWEHQAQIQGRQDEGWRELIQSTGA